MRMSQIPDLDWIGAPDGLQAPMLVEALAAHLDRATWSGTRDTACRVPAMAPDRLTTFGATRTLLDEIHLHWRWPEEAQREHADLLAMMAAALAGDEEAAAQVIALLRRRVERICAGADEVQRIAYRLRLRLAVDGWSGLAGGMFQPHAKGEEPALAPAPIEARRSVCDEILLSGDPQMDQRLRAVRRLHIGVRLLPAPDPDALAARLAAEMPQAATVIHWVRDRLVLRRYAGQKAFHLPPLLLHGPPGCGKSHLARRLLELAGVPHHLLSVAGSSDVRMLLGTARGWSTAQASLPALTMARQDAANPGLIVDEIDKAVEHSHNGSWTQALLGYLEPETARGMLDEFLGVEVDARHITWILTANDVRRLPAPLRSRLTCFELAPPDPVVLPRVIMRLLEGIAAELGTTAAMLPPIAPERLELARREYRRHPCLRRLRTLLQALLSDGLQARVLH